MFYRRTFMSAKLSMSLSASITVAVETSILNIVNPLRRSGCIQLMHSIFLYRVYLNIPFVSLRKGPFGLHACSTTNLFILGSTIIIIINNYWMSSISAVFITVIVCLYFQNYYLTADQSLCYHNCYRYY